MIKKRMSKVMSLFILVIIIGIIVSGCKSTKNNDYTASLSSIDNLSYLMNIRYTGYNEEVRDKIESMLNSESFNKLDYEFSNRYETAYNTQNRRMLDDDIGMIKEGYGDRDISNADINNMDDRVYEEDGHYYINKVDLEFNSDGYTTIKLCGMDYMISEEEFPLSYGSTIDNETYNLQLDRYERYEDGSVIAYYSTKDVNLNGDNRISLRVRVGVQNEKISFEDYNPFISINSNY